MPTLSTSICFAGGRIILFADVYSETEAEIYGTASENSGQINRLLKNWGVSVNFAKVIGDRSLGENLVSGSESGEKLSNLPTWLNLNGSAINARLPFTENIVSVRLRSAGSIDLHQVENVKASPLFATTEKGGRIDAETVRLHNRQAVSEQFAEEGKRFLAAVLLEGKADSRLSAAILLTAPDLKRKCCLFCRRRLKTENC